MLFRNKDGKYSIPVNLSSIITGEFKLDTGSLFTVISLRLLCKAVRCDDALAIKSELLSYGYITAVSYTKQPIRLVPIYIRNVVVGDEKVDRFYCLVNVDSDDSSLLIGTDFISACSIDSTNGCYGIKLSYLEQAYYEYNFKERCGATYVHEVYELESIKYRKGSNLSAFLEKAKGSV